MITTFPDHDRDRVKALLHQARNIAVITHHDPDGDAMGSCLGLVRVLRNAGATATAVLPNTPPAFLRWMPGHSEALAADRERARCEHVLREADLVFALDFNRPDRVKGLETALRAARQVVMIDHHQDPDGFATVGISDTAASSTCQMVFDVLHALSLSAHIDADAATDLYTGLMTDTGSFRFNSVTAHTLLVAAALVQRGAVPHAIYDRVMDENSEDRLRLLGFALSERMEVLHDAGVAIFHLSTADLERFRHRPGDTEGLVNHGLSISGIRLSAFFMQRADGVKVSLRSKGDLPVDRLTRDHFEGGGHVNAAGGRSAEDLPATIDRFKRLLPAFLAQHPA